MESSLLVLLGFQAGCRLGQLFHQYVQQTRVTGLGDQEYHETSLNCPLMWGSQAEVVSEGLHFGCLRHKTASPQWSANVTGPVNRREAAEEGRTPNDIPTTFCDLSWFCQSAEASLSWARLKTWRGEAFKQGSQEKESLRAWRQAAQKILLFRTKVFPALFLFFFSYFWVTFLFYTKSLVLFWNWNGIQILHFFNLLSRFLRKTGCIFNTSSKFSHFGGMRDHESIKSQWVQSVLPI